MGMQDGACETKWTCVSCYVTLGGGRVEPNCTTVYSSQPWLVSVPATTKQQEASLATLPALALVSAGLQEILMRQNLTIISKNRDIL